MNERLKELRKKLGLNQTEFGNVLGVTRAVIKNIELNVLTRPERKEPLIKLICKQFNVNEVWLRTGEGEIFNEEKASILNQLKEIVNNLSPAFQSYLLEQAKSLLMFQNSIK